MHRQQNNVTLELSPFERVHAQLRQQKVKINKIFSGFCSQTSESERTNNPDYFHVSL